MASQDSVTQPSAPSLRQEEAFAPGFSLAAVHQISGLKKEPNWMRERRLEAWDQYGRAPLPKWSRGIRAWWNVSLDALEQDHLIPFHGRNGLSPVDSLLASAPERSGLIVQASSDVEHAELDPALAAKGVIFTSMDKALAEHPDLVRRTFMSTVSPNEDKFTALHAALWSGGTFVYVPRGVTVALPLRTMVHLSGPWRTSFPHTLIVMEEGSELTYIEHLSSPALEGQAFHVGVTEVSVGPGARLNLGVIDHWGTGVFSLSTRRVRLDRESSLKWFNAFLGNGLTRSQNDTLLAGEQASAELAGLFFAAGASHLDLHSRTEHAARHTSSNVLVKGVLTDDAQAGMEGLIKIRKEAQHTESFLSDHTLMLSENARSDSLPSLEIEANDVRASHGATVGRIDEEQLFYLMSRGLPHADAEKLIVGGFLEQVLKQSPTADVRDTVQQIIQGKIDR